MLRPPKNTVNSAAKSTRFSSTNQPKRTGKHGGRKPGSQNIISREIKEVVITAANLVGSNRRGKDGLIGYMRRLAVRNEAVFGGLLRHVMGSQVTVEHTERHKKYQTVEEVVEELRRFGIVPMQQKSLPHYVGPELELDPAVGYLQPTYTHFLPSQTCGGQPCRVGS